jgi:hypothetical protein
VQSKTTITTKVNTAMPKATKKRLDLGSTFELRNVIAPATQPAAEATTTDITNTDRRK